MLMRPTTATSFLLLPLTPPVLANHLQYLCHVLAPSRRHDRPPQPTQLQITTYNPSPASQVTFPVTNPVWGGALVDPSSRAETTAQLGREEGESQPEHHVAFGRTTGLSVRQAKSRKLIAQSGYPRDFRRGRREGKTMGRATTGLRDHQAWENPRRDASHLSIMVQDAGPARIDHELRHSLVAALAVNI